MKRKITIIMLIFTVILIVFSLQRYLGRYISNKSEGTYKIGVISTNDERLHKVYAMIEGLSDYGYDEEELQIIIKNAEGDVKRLDNLIKEVIDEDVDVIVTTGSSGTSVAKEYTKDTNIPVVFIGVGCTVELGYVEDKINTGCNITGIDSHYVQLSGKRLEFLKKLVPDTEKILILYNPLFTPLGPSSTFLYEAAEKLEIELDFFPVQNRDDIINTISDNHSDFDGMMLMCSLLFENTVEEIIDVSLKYKLPVMGVSDIQVEKGLLGFYGSTNYDEGKQASRIIANILEGQDPKIIPIESPEKLECHINVKTAKALNIEIDYSEMSFVDKFVE